MVGNKLVTKVHDRNSATTVSPIRCYCLLLNGTLIYLIQLYFAGDRLTFCCLPSEHCTSPLGSMANIRNSFGDTSMMPTAYVFL